jgi:hypothetical protein
MFSAGPDASEDGAPDADLSIDSADTEVLLQDLGPMSPSPPRSRVPTSPNRTHADSVDTEALLQSLGPMSPSPPRPRVPSSPNRTQGPSVVIPAMQSQSSQYLLVKLLSSS